MAFPLVYFMSQFVTYFLNIFQPLLQAQPVFYSILVTLLFTLGEFNDHMSQLWQKYNDTLSKNIAIGNETGPWPQEGRP
jgi:hypothetical protein